MSEPKIRIKPLAAPSLAWRIVLISVSLLVIPLFFHSWFLYQREWVEKRADAKEILHLSASMQKALLEERIRIEWRLLDAVDGLPEEFGRRLGVFGVDLTQPVPMYFVLDDPVHNRLIIGKKGSSLRALAVAWPFTAIFQEFSGLEQGRYPLQRALIDGEGRVLAGEKSDSLFAVQLPLTGGDLSLFISIPEAKIEELHSSFYLYHFLSLLFFAGIVGGSLVWILIWRVSRPLKLLCQTMSRVSEGAVHARYIPDSMGFEINALGKQFNDTMDLLLTRQEEVAREKGARMALAEEMRIGHDIQESLLPLKLPLCSGLDSAAGFLPARQVGGDFYDFMLLKTGKILIMVADTAGKGISACLYALGLRSSLRTLAEREASLSEIVLSANDLFLKDVKESGVFVTLWIGIYDPQEMRLEFCSQGHPPAYLLREGRCLPLWTAGIALGAQTFDAISTKTISLTKGERLFLYTDGIIEAHDSENRLFGKERLQAFLVRSADLASETLVTRLLAEVIQFSREAPQHDDIALLALHILEKLE